MLRRCGCERDVLIDRYGAAASGKTARCADAENSMGMEYGAYAAGASSASVRGVSDSRRPCANGSKLGVRDRSEVFLSVDVMNAGGRGGGANGEVKIPMWSGPGDGDCIIEAGRLLPFRSKVSTSAFVRFERLLVCP